jgi:hypothetical protein
VLHVLIHCSAGFWCWWYAINVEDILDLLTHFHLVPRSVMWSERMCENMDMLLRVEMLVSRNVVPMNICVYFWPPSIAGTFYSMVLVAMSSLQCQMLKGRLCNLNHLQRTVLWGRWAYWD